MDDLIIQFARLWGQREVLILNADDEKLADILKSYDSIELRNFMQQWADEFLYDENNEDTVDFFEKKIEEMMTESTDPA